MRYVDQQGRPVVIVGTYESSGPESHGYYYRIAGEDAVKWISATAAMVRFKKETVMTEPKEQPKSDGLPAGYYLLQEKTDVVFGPMSSLSDAFYARDQLDAEDRKIVSIVFHAGDRWSRAMAVARQSPGMSRMAENLGEGAETLRQDTIRLQEEAMAAVPKNPGTSQAGRPRRDDEYPAPSGAKPITGEEK